MMLDVAAGRLTRQELGWLLAQEAQGAAKSLRDEVTSLRRSLEPATNGDRISSLPGERNLNTLDATISMLSELQDDDSRARANPRRGRVDVAALLYEVVPDWSISIAPGAGTEVYGSERDFRRIFQVLLAQAQGPGVDRPSDDGSGSSNRHTIQVRREGDWVRISVALGPDAAALNSTDRGWLSRMTLRYGGRLELQGKTQSVLLPAETTAQEELQELRRELAQAQKLGETYARELASVFTAEPEPAATAPPAPRADEQRAEWLIATLKSIARAEPRDEPPSSPNSLVLRLALALDDDEPRARVNVGQVLSAALEPCLVSATARRVGLRQSEAPALLLAEQAPRTLKTLISTLVHHAIAATPADAGVDVTLKATENGFSLELEDGGPAVTEHNVADLLEQRLDPASVGRPRTLELQLAHAIATRLGAQLTLTMSPSHRALTRVVFAN